MTKRIAVCGKGGTGKTTITSAIVKYLIDKNITPILVVDADPNSNLAETLGVNYNITIADVREELREANIPQGWSKSDYINLRLQEALVEHENFDLIVMGRPEGRECYCFVNELLRNFLSNLSKNYKYVIIDTEAGMEHLSRRTTDNIDLLIITATPTKAAIDTVKKIKDLIPKLKLKIAGVKVIINMVENAIHINTHELKIDAVIHKDINVYSWSEEGIPLINKLDTTSFYNEVKQFLDNVISY